MLLGNCNAEVLAINIHNAVYVTIVIAMKDITSNIHNAVYVTIVIAMKDIASIFTEKTCDVKRREAILEARLPDLQKTLNTETQKNTTTHLVHVARLGKYKSTWHPLVSNTRLLLLSLSPRGRERVCGVLPDLTAAPGVHGRSDRTSEVMSEVLRVGQRADDSVPGRTVGVRHQALVSTLWGPDRAPHLEKQLGTITTPERERERQRETDRDTENVGELPEQTLGRTAGH